MPDKDHYDPPVVLTIAGFDPSGGAGVIADVHTIQSFGCTAVAAITSITFQNTAKYFGAVHQPADVVRKQIEAVVLDYRIRAVKIGMLPTAEMISQIAWLIGELSLPSPVIDPVMESTSGGRLMADDDAFELFVAELLPLSRLVTPNIPEAEKLAGMNIRDEDEMRQAAARIRELGARAVLIKGGHLGTQASRLLQSSSEGAGGTPAYPSEAIDLLDDQGEVRRFRGDWIEAPPVRGTGCKLSSAIAACLAKGMSLAQSVSAAKTFVAAEIQNSTPKNLKSEI